MNDITTNQTTYPTLFDLFQHWGSAGYPDYVTGIWSNDGSAYNLTVGVVEGAAGEAGKQEILDLIEDDASVTFTTQSYSHNYLLQVQEELNPYFKQEESGMIFTGVDDMNNCVTVGISDRKEGDETTQSFIADLQHTYGDAISIEYTGTIVTQTTEELGLANPLAPSTAGKTSFSPLMIAGLILIPLLLFGVYFALRKRFVPVIQTNEGGTFTQTDRISVKEVEELVKDSALTVSKDVDKKVMDEIGKLRK